LAPACLADDAGVRHAGGDPKTDQSAGTEKKPAAGAKAPAELIRWSVQEIRRITQRLAQQRLEPTSVIAWSCWRRAHQAAAKTAHLKQKSQL
jgi:hypothetical protein